MDYVYSAMAHLWWGLIVCYAVGQIRNGLALLGTAIGTGWLASGVSRRGETN